MLHTACGVALSLPLHTSRRAGSMTSWRIEFDHIWINAKLATFDSRVNALCCGLLENHALAVRGETIAAILPMDSLRSAHAPYRGEYRLRWEVHHTGFH